MSYSVEFTLDATAEIETLTPTIQKRILRKIRWLLDNFETVNHKALTANLTGFFKLRVGDYRVIYSFIVAEKRIIIHKVGHRSSIYN